MPWTVFDEETGKLYLANEQSKQLVARFGADGKVYVWWRWGNKEVPLSFDEIAQYNRRARKT